MAIRQDEISKRPDVSLPTTYVPRYARSDYDPQFELSDSTALFDWLDQTNYVWTYRVSSREPRVRTTDEAFRDIDSAYEPVTHKTHSSQQDCADAWAEMQFPAHNVSRSGGPTASPEQTRPWKPGDHGFRVQLYSSPNFRGYQYADGSGLLEHYSTTECWRTRSGLIINNTECAAYGFAHCTTPGRRDYHYDRDSGEHWWTKHGHHPDLRLSETIVETWCEMIHDRAETVRERVASDGGEPTPVDDDKYDLMSVEEVPDGHTRLDGSIQDLTIYQFYSGAALVSLTDLTARGHGGDRVSFALAPVEARPYRIGKREWAQVVQDKLTPALVDDADLPIVGAHESDDDARIPGDAIIRQGEWFFIPMDRSFAPDEELSEDWATRDDFLGSHTPRDFGVRRLIDGADEYQEDLTGQPTLTDDLSVSDAQSVEFYVKGWLDHPRDHERAYIGERWHRAVQHSRDDVRVFSDDEHQAHESPSRSGSSRRRTRSRGRID